MQSFEVTLKPRSFIQSFSPALSFPASTTVFGAICWGIKAIWGTDALKGLLPDFTQHSQFFFLSSAFPLLETGDLHIRFFPMPKLGIPAVDEEVKDNELETKKKVDRAEKHKGFKAVKFVSESLFRKILAGELTRENLFREFVDERCIKEGGFLFTLQDYGIATQKRLLPRISPVARATIDRVSGSTSGGGEFFYDFRLLPGSFSGYFLLKARDIEFLKPVFRYLEDTGIGGERSIGLNRYKIELTEIDLAFLNGDSKKLVTLSQWGVNPAELDDAKANEFRYGLLPYRRKLETGFDFKNSGQLWGSKALYFAEGSVLVVKERRDFYGQLRDSTVVGSEKVVDYGICFPAFLTGGS